MLLRRLAAEPLLYFILVGAGLFLLSNWWSGRDARVIVVDHAALLSYVREQSRSFAPGEAEARLQQASPEELDALVRSFVRDEALFREAVALGFDQTDYVIRRRLVQRMELMSQGFATTDYEPTAAELEDFYRRHIDRYSSKARLSFAHVYIADDQTARERAAAKLTELNMAQVALAEANQHGDRFAYHQHYVDRARDLIAGHFGAAFAAEIVTLKVDATRWQGPLRSAHGWHLVLLTQHSPAGPRSLDESLPQVRADLRQQRIADAAEQAIQQMVDRYEVRRLVDMPAANASNAK